VSDPLAILGGQPRFTRPRHVGSPNRGDRERFLARVEAIWERNWFTNDGPVVREFEAEIARQCEARYCVAMCNGTVALEIAARALGMTGEVIVPAYTFVATAHSLQWQGITPIFCDVDLETHNVNVESLRRCITPRTGGIVGVHLWGRPCSPDAMESVAKEFGLPLLFDAAHAFACGLADRSVGSFGDAEVLSFHATKFVNSFEGGAVLTNNADLVEKMRLMRNFGFAGYDRVVHVGANGKMTEVCAAMGLTSLESLDPIVAVNKAHHGRYAAALAATPGLKLMDYADVPRHNYQYIVVEVDEGPSGLSRDELVKVLHAENVLARRYFFPGVHQMEPYRSQPDRRNGDLSITEQLCRSVLLLPTGTSMTPADIDQIGGILRTAHLRADEVREKIRRDGISVSSSY
jgi:dTDP-4-amino-4,6-dideoxygalactose transaminase